MTKLKYLLVSLIISNILSAQVRNPGFETPNDSIQKNSVTRSVRISNVEDEKNQANFCQTIAFKTENIRKSCIPVYIKTEKAERGAWLTAKMIDHKTGKTIGFATTKLIEGSTNWEKNKSILIAEHDADVRISGVLKSKGIGWFDDIIIEETPLNDSTPPTKDVSELIDRFVDTVQTYSLYKDSINWTALRNNITRLSTGIKSMEDAHTILNYVIDKLRLAGDNHSSIVFPSSSNTTQATQMKDLAVVPEGKYMGDNIGYIKLPYFNTIDSTSGMIFGDMIVKIIKRIDTRNTINGWIVDLRDDYGGSMFPMITGLIPIIGTDTLGYFVNKEEKIPWFTTKEGSWVNSVIKVKTNKSYTIKNRNAKIAVLIGPRTASSGEATAISFIGKTNTKLFGQSSGGYTSSNKSFKLRDGSYLILATAVEADRNMKLYHAGISPDVIVESSADETIDNCIEVAKKWILKK